VFETLKASSNLYQKLRSGRIRITGHSLGGAVAVLLAVLLRNDKINVFEIVTFGQPMVTNEDGARIWNSGELALPLFRFWNQDDIVPTLPPAISRLINWAGGYYHFGYLCRYTNSQGRISVGDPAVVSPGMTLSFGQHSSWSSDMSYDSIQVAVKGVALDAAVAKGLPWYSYLDQSPFGNGAIASDTYAKIPVVFSLAEVPESVAKAVEAAASTACSEGASEKASRNDESILKSLFVMNYSAEIQVG